MIKCAIVAILLALCAVTCFCQFFEGPITGPSCKPGKSPPPPGQTYVGCCDKKTTKCEPLRDEKNVRVVISGEWILNTTLTENEKQTCLETEGPKCFIFKVKNPEQLAKLNKRCAKATAGAGRGPLLLPKPTNCVTDLGENEFRDY